MAAEAPDVTGPEVADAIEPEPESPAASEPEPVPEPEPQPEPAAEVASDAPATETAETPGTDEEVSLEAILEDLKRREGRSE